MASSTLAQVSSYEYVIAATLDTPGILNAIANSPSDLIILGGGAYQVQLDKHTADPSGNKLIFGYIDVAEASQGTNPDLFTGGTLPSWFGNQHPGYPGLYSVQYWNPAWESAIFNHMDQLVADGYDGIYLDVLGGFEWQPGNPLGNPVYPDATKAMATLLSEIRAHLDSNPPSRPFYLIGGGPQGIAQSYPSSLTNLDAIFNESVYYSQTLSNGLVSAYNGTGDAYGISTILAPLYDSAHVPVFGNDYPPLSDQAADLMTFEFYTQLGWLPSVNTAYQTDQILSTGPFMFVAKPQKTSVVGVPGVVNFLSGGCLASATLIGGNQGDYFIGGPGHNTITGGSGNDTIYAHPASAGLKNILDFQIAATNMNGTTPSVSIYVNGQMVVAPTPITAVTGMNFQEFQVNAIPFEPISSVKIVVTGTYYADQSDFSNVEIESIAYNGIPVVLSSGTYSSGGPNSTGAYSNKGTVVFPASAFQQYSPFLRDTSDYIEGGGGTNTVVYRSASTTYTITKNSDGSVTVVGNLSAEGPDTLRNIQVLQFSDEAMTIN